MVGSMAGGMAGRMAAGVVWIDWCMEVRSKVGDRGSDSI